MRNLTLNDGVWKWSHKGQRGKSVLIVSPFGTQHRVKLFDFLSLTGSKSPEYDIEHISYSITPSLVKKYIEEQINKGITNENNLPVLNSEQ